MLGGCGVRRAVVAAVVVVSVVVVGGSNAVVTADGFGSGDATIGAWGDDSSGQGRVPVAASPSVAVAAGKRHSISVRDDGTVVAWGYNSDGQATVPVGLADVTDVAAGDLHSLALRDDGNVVAWGSDESPLIYSDDRRYYGQATVPVGISDVTAIAAGGFHSLALQVDGRAVAWGRNSEGQSTVPVGLNDVTAIAAGWAHSLALRADGTVVAWGWNSEGQSAVPAGLADVIAVSAGRSHSLALRADGTVVAWGSNAQGQSAVPGGLGDVVAVAAGEFHSLAVRADGTLVAWGANDYGEGTVPVGLTDVTAVAAGGFHNLVLRGDGSLVAWGYNDSGQSTVPVGLDEVVAVAAGAGHSLALHADGTVVGWGASYYGQATPPVGLTNVIAVAAGGDHSLALRADGTVVGWGYNDYGQATPPVGLTDVIAVAAGTLHSLALRADGTVVGWGYNDYGQATPPVGLTDVIAVAAGGYHGLALRVDGTVVSWGWNGYGYGQATVPVGLADVTAVAAGWGHSLARRADGTVVAWGQNSEGQATVPTGLTDVTAISGGGSHSLALLTNGRVVAWGANDFGQVTTPTGLTDVTAISAGAFHNLVITALLPSSPGPIDTDSDGIPDDLDLDPSTPSATFSDGAGSSGQVLTNETGAPITLIDLPDPDGVRIITGGSTGQATVKVCGNYSMQVPAASDISMTCGSLTVSVAQGGPLVISPSGDGVVTITIPGGVTARLSTLVQDEFTLDHLGGAQFITVRHPSEESDYTWPAPKTTQLGAGDSRTFKDNADPVVNRVFLDKANVEVGEMVTLTAPFSDVGVNDVHTCVVYWEPNVESPGTITADTCTATHVYTGLGVYYPYLVVRDGDGGSGTRDATVVVYDPDTYWTLDPAGPFLEGVGGGDIAVDPNTGDVWVAGYLRNGSGQYPSVVRLSPNGDLEVEIAGCSCGTPGLVNNPIAVAVGPTGDAYVIDYGNNRVKQFAANGAFVRSFAFSFGQPLDIATDAAGNVYVADYGSGYVRRFSSSGTYLSNLGGTGTKPYSVAVDHDGNVWVADFEGLRDKVHKIDPVTGQRLVTINGLGQPNVIGFDDLGQVHISNFNTKEIRTYTSDGIPVAARPMPAIESENDGYWHISQGEASGGAIDRSGELLVPFGDDFVLRFVPPAPVDTDGDGIPDSIECSPDVAGSFCDVDGNGHVGQLLTNGTGAPVTFADLPAPAGVRVSTGGTSGQASIQVCGFVTVQVQAGTELNVSCGSVMIEVLSGTAVVVTLDDGDGVTTVTIPPGVKAKISNLVNERFTVDYISGDQPVTVVVDGITTLIDGDTDSVEFNANVPPTIQTFATPSAPVALDAQPVWVSATFTDPGINDTHTCSVTWQPDVTTAGTIDGSTCTASHSYTDAGDYTVEVTITDDSGDSSSTSATITIYDDNVAPTATISSPTAGETVIAGGALVAAYSCVDEVDGSGLASCVGEINGVPVSDGDGLPTGTLGTKQLIVTAIDNAGNTSIATASYEVVEASLALTPTTAVVGTNISQTFSVEGFDAVGNSLGDRTAGAVFTISPNGSCTLNACRSGTTGSKTVTARIGTMTATATLDVRVRQTISFPTIGGRTMLQSPVAVSATATSGLPVTFTTTTPAVCVAGGLNGSSITLIGPGTCTVRADQAGDDTWAPAVSVLRNSTVRQVAQTITFSSLTGKLITESPVVVSATASSGLPVTFTTTTPTVCTVDGTTITLLDAGRCTVRAEQPGDSVYRSANPVNRSFTVSKLAQTITFPAIGTRTLAESPVTVTATASSGLPVWFTTTTPTVCTADGGTITLVAAGTCTVRAAQPGDSVYRSASPVNRSFTIAKVAQTITFPAIGTRTTAQSPITLTATASSGLPVTFTTTTPTVCTAGGTDGSSITLLTTGTCTVRAEQAGDDYWRAAPAVNRGFTVTLPPPEVQTFAASPTVLSSAGGSVDLSGTASSAATCRFTVSPALAGFPLTVPCTGGSASATATLPANTTTNSRSYTFGFSALRPGATTAIATPVAVRVAPASEPVADLSVSAAASADPAKIGRPLTYVFTVANAGPDTASDVDFASGLPSGATFVSAAATQGSGCVVEFGIASCALGAVASGDSADVTIVVVPNTPGSRTIAGSVTSAATDANPANDETTLDTIFFSPPIVYTDDQTGTIRRMEPFSGSVALTTQPGGKSDAVVSPDGRTVAYWRQSPAPEYASEIWMVGIDGTNERLVATVGVSMVPRVSWSPDSSKIVFSVLTGGKWKATVASAVGAPNPQLLIPDMTYGESAPAYSPDGSKIIFLDSCQRPSPAQCRYHLVDADGIGTPVPYATYPIGRGVVWDPDGEWFYFAVSSAIYRGRVDGTLAEPIATNAYGGTYWSLSPQGDRIAFTEYVGGKYVISVVDVDGSNRQQLTTAYTAADPAGCYSPVWTTDQSAIVMHCYPGSGAIGIYQVNADLTTAVAPTGIGGSFRSRNPELAGSRPTN